MTGKRGWIIAISSVVYLALLFSCAPATGDLSGERMISLTIGGSSGARAVGVTQYDISSLDIEIYDPDGNLHWDAGWTPDQGRVTYNIPVTTPGTYEIVVVHHGLDGDEAVSATESAEFSIASMMITVINITPGAIGLVDIDGDAEVSPLIGVWENIITMVWVEYEGDSDVVVAVHEFDVLLHMEFNDAGEVIMLDYFVEDGIPSEEPAEEMSLKGTYECPVDGIVCGVWTHWWTTGVGWETDGTTEDWQVGVEFQDDNNTLIVDLSEMMPDAIWTLYRVEG